VERTITTRISHLTRLLTAYGEWPPYWARDVHMYIKNLERALSRGDYAIPFDIPTRFAREDYLTLLQLLVRMTGDIFSSWPAMAQTARKLVEDRWEVGTKIG
jgi:hypothetical protein